MSQNKQSEVPGKPAPFGVKLSFTAQRLQDLLICAFEGGVGYWCRIVAYSPPHLEGKVSYREVPFLPGGSLLLRDIEDGQDLSLNREAMEAGLTRMCLRYPRHFARFVTEDEDAETGDVFIQCCVFGEVRYG
jgi:hypothetical protein